MFLIDSDHFTILHGRPSAERDCIRRWMSQQSGSDFFVPAIVFHERLRGWLAYLNRHQTKAHIVRAYSELEVVLTLFSESSIAPFSLVAATTFDELRASRVRIGVMDLRIASIALTRDFTLLTRNAVDFDKVPGLRHEDWTLPHRPK